ncbi:photosystem II reaction center protein Psb28 [Synechococcus elongatus]|uniref:Photosystem II reaction center Psb28 protein n=2 Tax=Synechococcus elongatus TaxID=32046 RepID=A0AAN1QQQ7_SYNEL|nr:photosystem II reaction center protein Psb28 [Synechococcus elongatus]AZB73746.1 photosystem II reaction center protein Psb28 [Synechococcus elongatus PCC 11801]QFZ92393.1 photosystem II reaction center protein Psb28 [Synechococcus elongatus PCC 11802]
MPAAIQFTRGIDEPVVPDVRLTRSRDGQSGTATFYFDEPQALVGEVRQDITGMYLLDDEGELATREVKAKFINGQPAGLEAVYLMRSPDEWDRFMRFMQRYAEANGLGFTQA